MASHEVITLIKSVFNKDKNNFKLLLEKASDELPKRYVFV